MINTKEIKKILADETGFYSNEELIASPCWEVKVDKEQNKLLFLINGEEKYSHNLSKVSKPLSVEYINSLVKLLRSNNLAEIKKELKK